MRVERIEFVKGSNNDIELALTNKGSLLTGSWTELVIYLGYPTATVTLTRASPGGNGITLVAGVLTINPGLITEDLAALAAGMELRGTIRVKSSTNAQGLYFGEDDSDQRLIFAIKDPPGAP